MLIGLLDGFAVADGRRPRAHRHGKAVGKALGGDAQVHFALAPDHHVVVLGVVHDGERGVFLGELGEGLPQLDVVLALLRLHGDGEHRRIGLHLDERSVCLLAGGQRIAGLGLVELAEGNGLAGSRRAALFGVLPHELEYRGDAPGFAGRRIQGGAVADLARQHAGNRHLAAMRGVQRLQHQRQRLAAGLGTEARGDFCHARHLMADRLEQTQHAVGAGGGADQHRADDAVAQFLGEIVEHLVARRLDVLEQLLHQLVVVVGQRLQHGEARFLLAAGVLTLEFDDFRRRVLLVDKGAFEREIDEA